MYIKKFLNNIDIIIKNKGSKYFWYTIKFKLIRFNVINIDKETYSSNFYNTKNFCNSSNYKFVKCDLNESLKLKKIIFKHRPRCIFNLAAETHVDRSIESPKDFIESSE